MKSFRGKVALVTGSAGGIGQALAVELAKRGADVAHCDIGDMAETSRMLARFPDVRCHAEFVDVGDREAVLGFTRRVIDELGCVDVLINNAGIALGDRTFEEVTREDFERITAVNYWGVVHTTQALYSHLLVRPEAAIANISSAQGVLGVPYLVPYCTTKFAVRGFTDALRMEHEIRGIDNVTVHCVHPGSVATDITINADYQGVNSSRFHEDLQRGLSPEGAARKILDGICKGRGRIFVSDGRAQDMVARIMPNHAHHLVRFLLKLKKATIR